MNNRRQQIEESIRVLYGNDTGMVKEQLKRYEKLADQFGAHFKTGELHFFSTPGRTEISGNHTDHNHGRVLAASINRDSIAVASKSKENKIELFSEGYEEPFRVDLNHLKPIAEEKGTTAALIRGIASRLKQLGYHIGGFNACITSDVLPGSGLSSSASIEVLIGAIFNVLYNENQIPAETIAKIGQFAENKYFGKPCGLMDQMACAVGGIISIDFEDPANPLVNKVEFNLDMQQYSLLVVDTGGSHADLTDDYASVPAEMKAVAKFFGAEVLREISMDAYLEKIPDLRRQVGDRAVLRGLHFLRENERVAAQVAALESGNFQKFLELVKGSGNSSFKWLQNIYSPNNIKEQGVTLGLALTEKYIADIGQGACRVHGGGFAGTILVFLPNEAIQKFKEIIEPIFGEASIQELSIRPTGTVRIL